MRTNQIGRTSVIIAAVVFAAATSFAGTINHGDFDDVANGGTVYYTDVTETSVTDSELYGVPAVSVNTMDFDPQEFGAYATGGVLSDVLDGRLDFGVSAMGGHYIPEIEITERGDFTLFGIGTEATFVYVDTPVDVTVNAIDGVALATPIVFSDSMTFVPPDGTYNLVNDAGIGVLWSGSVGFDLNQLLTDAGVAFNMGATSIDVGLNNMMAAGSEAGSIAEITKKDFKAFSISIVPEPSTIGLVLLGLVAAAHARRRR